MRLSCGFKTVNPDLNIVLIEEDEYAIKAIKIAKKKNIQQVSVHCLF